MSIHWQNIVVVVVAVVADEDGDGDGDGDEDVIVMFGRSPHSKRSLLQDQSDKSW